MARLRIPERYLPGLTTILSLPDESVDRIVQVLREARSGTIGSELVRDLAAQVPTLSITDVENLVGTLTSLYALRSDLEVTLPQLVDEVIAAIELTVERPLGPSSESETRFRSILNRLLDIESLALELKKFDLSLEYEHTFCTARILTDIRPVFGPDPADPPVGAVLVHTLKLSYHDREDLRHFYVAMNSTELAALKRVIDRAEQKANGIKSLLASGDFSSLEVL